MLNANSPAMSRNTEVRDDQRDLVGRAGSVKKSERVLMRPSVIHHVRGSRPVDSSTIGNITATNAQPT